MLGLGVAALGARWQIRRSMAEVRSAERRARSAERLAEIGAMTGGLAHEIKNPLSTIGLNAQLLAEAVDELPGDRAVEPEVRQRLTRRLAALRREVERLKGILTDFLNFAGEIRLDLHEVDVNRVVDELADFFAPQAQQQGVRLRTELAPQPLPARLDASQLKQALLNLMLNAVQAMATAKPERGDSKELIIRTSGEVDQGRPVIVVHVIDTGPGIDAEVIPRVFTPYFTTKSGGTGLGLPTTRRLIEAHHGRIDVHTELGKGTDFVVTLPALEREGEG